MSDSKSVERLVGYFASVWGINQEMLEQYLNTEFHDWGPSHLDRLKMLRLDLVNKAIEPEHLIL